MDSGATEHSAPDATDLYGYVTASPGTTVEVANDTHEEGVKGYGKLDLLVKEPGGIVKATTLQRVALLIAHNIYRNPLSAKQATNTSGKEMFGSTAARRT